MRSEREHIHWLCQRWLEGKSLILLRRELAQRGSIVRQTTGGIARNVHKTLNLGVASQGSNHICMQTLSSWIDDGNDWLSFDVGLLQLLGKDKLGSRRHKSCDALISITVADSIGLGIFDGRLGDINAKDTSSDPLLHTMESNSAGTTAYIEE